MFDHISLGVRDIERSRGFYDAALAPFGVTLKYQREDMLGYGSDEIRLWISPSKRPVPADMESGLHFCFAAPTREAVQAFHAAAIKAGGTDNGAPGPRKEYGDNYYAAFVIDPDGFRLEAYCGS